MEASNSRSVRADAASLSSLILGFRFFALAAVTGTVGLLPPDQVSVRLVVIGVLAAAALAWLQKLAVHFVSRSRGAWFSWLHVAAWTLMIHATGGQGSPLVLGYLLELPLSGAQLGRRGVVVAAAAAIIWYAFYAASFGGPLDPRATAILIGIVGVCAAITWRVIGMLERQTTMLETSRVTLVDRAETLAEELRLLGDSLGDALLTIDHAGRVARLNPSGAALLGIDPAGCVGKPWQEILRPDAVSRARVAETLDTGLPQRGLALVLAPGAGTSVTVKAEMWRGVGSDGQHVHLLLDAGGSAIHDDPVRRLGESAACVAHQIKNSMHSIQGYVAGLRHPADPGSATEECLGALRGLGDLAEDVLALAGASRAQRERVAIQNVLRSAIVLLNQPPIRLAVPARPVYVEVPRGQLVHAVFNLLDNAVQVTPPGEAVHVRAEHRDASVIVDIADAGPGPPATSGQQFGPLPSKNGSGLGLVAARRFLEACGGCLSFTAAERGGTLCRLELPAAPTSAFTGGR